MATTRTARTTRKSTADTAAPTATPAPVQASPATDADVTAPDTDQADATTTATYTIPDHSTLAGDADRAAYVARVGAAYRDADKGTKAAIRTAWKAFQNDALRVLDMDRLELVRDVNAVLVTARPTVEVDPADAYNITISALRAAAERLYDQFGLDHGDEAHARLDALMAGDRDEVTAASIAAMTDKLAVVRTGNRRTGPQRSVEAHIKSALDAAPAGTILTCAQVHNHRSDAYGPDESPSVGAIGAAHGREMDGIKSVTNDAKVKGFQLA